MLLSLGDSKHYLQQIFSYNSLNRPTSITEKLNGTGSDSFKQVYSYDRWGNRSVDFNQSSTNVPRPIYTVDTNTNRLIAPTGYTFGYDNAGNQTNDNYTGGGQRVFDAENHLTGAQQYYGWQYYKYSGSGLRVRRIVNGVEVWQVYGIGGGLLAEYQPGAASFVPTREYGYRGGQLLVSLSSGDDLRLLKFLHKLYIGALGRSPNSTEQQQGMDSLSTAGGQGQAGLLSAAQTIAASLFNSTEYTQRNRTDAQFVTDLYWA